MKFVKRNCTSSALSNMYSLMPKAYSAPKGKPMARGVVKKGSRTEVAKVRFAENMEDTFSTCDENNNHRYAIVFLYFLWVLTVELDRYWKETESKSFYFLASYVRKSPRVGWLK